jgi:ribosome-binding protein aMBF1 (putative translation factor)
VIAARARAAVAANDAGWSYDQLAGELGVSKSLIQQLVAAGRAQHEE